MMLSDLIATFRTQADDLVEPYLWSDDEVAGYFADAEHEACLRARLIADETTPTVAVIDIDTAAWIDLHPTLIDVVRVRLASDPDIPLTQCPPNVLDAQWPGWETQTGTPTRYYVLGRRLRLIPQPTAESDTLYLSVYRTPLVPLSFRHPGAQPEIPEMHHRGLLNWALHQAYLKRDSSAYNPSGADVQRQLFFEAFGPRPSGHAIRQQWHKRQPVVRPIAF